MQWQQPLRKLEQSKQWDEAIAFMQNVIQKNPDDVNAHIAMNYLLMNTLVEEHPNKNQRRRYEELILNYFQDSFSKFNKNAEYLFYTGIMSHISEWYFDIDIEEGMDMITTALNFEPNNVLYSWGYYVYLNMSNMDNQLRALPYAEKILQNELSLKDKLKAKGAIGDYLLEIMTNWFKRISAKKESMHCLIENNEIR